MNHTSGRFYSNINSYINDLTKTELKVADFILENMDETIYMTVTELAEQVKVGETTVLRFCRKIGYKSYQSFKLALTVEVAKQSSELYDVYDEQDEMNVTQSLVLKTIENNIKIMKETSSLIDTNELEKAIECIISKKRIVIYGSSVSGNTAKDARNKFLRIGIIMEIYTDSHMQAMSAATLTKDDLAIGISVSGSTKDTIDALNNAKEKGAKILAITQSSRSPITKISDVVLIAAGRETPLQGGSMGVKISQLLLIEMLFNGVANQMKEAAKHYRELTAKSVLNKAY